jgi:hypothetical protein
LLPPALVSACLAAPDAEHPPQAVAEPQATTTEVRSALVADVVLHSGDSASGWSASAGNTISLSSARQQGSGSVQSVGSAQDRFRHTNLGPVDARTAKYLTFWYFIDDASKIRTDRNAQVEISSSTAVDTEEMNWNFHSQRVFSGWNFVRLALPGKLRSQTSASINLAAIRRFRLYHLVSGSVTTRIDDIRFTDRNDSPVGSSCSSVAANATIRSVGSAGSGTTYGTSGCDRSYVVDLQDYAPAGYGGTIVSYAGANTTDASVCASTVVSAYVYRKRPTTGVYEAIPDRRGAFGTTMSGRMVRAGQPDQICQRPYLKLELEYPLFLAGGSYRVVMRSERVVSGVREFGHTILATPQPPVTPSSVGVFARDLVNDSQARTAAVLRARSIAVRSADRSRTACRLARFNAMLMDRGGAAAMLVALGASSSAVNSGYVPAVKRMAEEVCRARFDSTYDAALLGIATWHNTILDQVAARFGIDRDVAAGLVDNVMAETIRDMVNRCAPNQSTLAAFWFAPAAEGTDPAKIQDNFFVACTTAQASANVSTRAQQVANALASGQGTSGFTQCMETVLSKELENKCSDPRAIITGPLPPDVTEHCAEQPTEDAQDKCIDDALRRQKEKEKAEEEEAEEEQDPPPSDAPYESCDELEGFEKLLCEGAQRELDLDITPSADEIAATRGIADTVGGIPLFFDILIGAIDKLTVDFFPWFMDVTWTLPLEGENAARENMTVIQERRLRELCAIVQHPKCKGLEKLDRKNNQRCVGEALGARAIGYPTDDGPFVGQHATTVFDSMNACWCQHIGIPVFSATCMTEEERRREDCVQNPWGPDDAPRRECLGYLQASSGLDESALLGNMCHYIRPNCDDSAYIDRDSQCGCWRPNVDQNPAINCPNANAINCGPDSLFDQRSCGCQPLGSGENPWGGDPLCGNEPRFSPGGRDGFITANRNDLLTNRFVNLGGLPTVDFHMVRAGGFVPVATPALFTRAFQNLGDRLDVTIKMPDAVAQSGYRGAVQLYCTSENVTNRFLGQKELQNLALGGMHTLGFGLSPQDLELCTGTDGAWRFEVAVNSDRQTVQRVGIGKILFAGNSVPVPEPLPLCPAPGGDPPPPPMSLPPEFLVDRIANPTTWTFSNGSIGRIQELLPR